MNPILAFGRMIARTFFRTVVIEGRDRLPENAPIILTPNHPNGLLDPILLLFLSPPLRLHFVAKAPLFKIPVFGSMLRSIGAIPVMRKMDASGDVDYSAFFASCVEALQRGGSVVIFPEGRSLPQSYLAPLKTGPARLFFLAREKGADVKIVPVGLNYERGSIFRSGVFVALAAPIETSIFEQQFRQDPVNAVREITEKIGESLKDHVVQSESYRDRELMLLLERIYGDVPEDEDWRNRFARWKIFETGLASLRADKPQSIDSLRRLLSRYQRLSTAYRIDRSTRSWMLLLLPFAAIGWMLNAIPYHIVDLLVRRYDDSDAATFKVVYSLFAFPVAYAAEALLLGHFFGTTVAVIFAILIVPLSYFSQEMSDWWEEHSPSLLLGASRQRAAAQLSRLRQRIAAEVDLLAAELERISPRNPLP